MSGQRQAPEADFRSPGGQAPPVGVGVVAGLHWPGVAVGVLPSLHLPERSGHVPSAHFKIFTGFGGIRGGFGAVPRVVIPGDTVHGWPVTGFMLESIPGPWYEADWPEASFEPTAAHHD